GGEGLPKKLLLISERCVEAWAIHAHGLCEVADCYPFISFCPKKVQRLFKRLVCNKAARAPASLSYFSLSYFGLFHTIQYETTVCQSLHLQHSQDALPDGS